MNTSIQQGCTKLIKSDSINIYNIKIPFEINAVLLNFPFIKESSKNMMLCTKILSVALTIIKNMFLEYKSTYYNDL